MASRSVLSRVVSRSTTTTTRQLSTRTHNTIMKPLLQNGNGNGNASAFVGIAAVGYLMMNNNNNNEMTIYAKEATVDWTAVKQDIVNVIEQEDARRSDGTGIGPTFVRLAWHQSGTYSKHDATGGSNGAYMRYNPECNWGANAGLGIARAMLEPVKAKHPHLSYADLWVFASKVAIEEMGGPVIPFTPGRTDDHKGTTVPDGRLPNADMGCPKDTITHIRGVFEKYGFGDEGLVTLSGAHALGRCHEDASGYWGPWTNAETTFSNEYFRLLIEEKWTLKKTHKGKPWTGPEQYENPDGSLMMLPSDIALIQDPELKKIVVAFANDEELFFKKFAEYYGKLVSNGCPMKSSGSSAGGPLIPIIGPILAKLKGFIGL